jgi:hypothetical protein
MKKLLNLSFIVFTLFFSCKKDDQITNKISTGTHSNVGENTYKWELIDMGNGVYQYPSYNGLTIKVTGIFYKTRDDEGNVIPVRDGDPVYGTIQVLDGDIISIEQPNNVPQNHFSIVQGIVSWGNGEPDFASYFSAFNGAKSSWTSAIAGWQAGLEQAWGDHVAYPNPIPSVKFPLISGYLPANGGAGTRTVTGQLIRSTTGTGYAIAREDYPTPAPFQPFPYTLNQLSQTLTCTSTTSGGIKTVTLKDNTTSTKYTPTFTFKLTSDNKLHKTGSFYDVTSSYTGITWTQQTELFPDYETIAPNKISFGVMGHFNSAAFTTSNFPVLITYNYSTNTATISYYDSKYMDYWKTTAE